MQDAITPQTYEYMSPEWVAASGNVIQHLFADQNLQGLDLSFSEAVTNAPEHLWRYDSSTIGWCISIANGQITIDDKPRGDATTRVVADYQTFREIQKFTFDDSPERINQSKTMRQDAAAQGKFTFEGSLATVPPAILQIISAAHDEIGRLTT